jgi:hypothetical protein
MDKPSVITFLLIRQHTDKTGRATLTPNFSALEAPAWDLLRATGSDRPRQRQNDKQDHENGDQ